MSILVLAEHNNEELKTSTLSTISAASEIHENIEVLVIGSGCDQINNKLKNIKFVKKIIEVVDVKYTNPIAELISPIIILMSFCWAAGCKLLSGSSITSRPLDLIPVKMGKSWETPNPTSGNWSLSSS